jgi:hypothetical protein
MTFPVAIMIPTTMIMSALPLLAQSVLTFTRHQRAVFGHAGWRQTALSEKARDGHRV